MKKYVEYEDQTFDDWYDQNYATDMTQMEYFLDRIEDMAAEYDEDAIPSDKLPEIAKRWAEIAEAECWSGAWNYPAI